jgi:hypothetical protein
MVMIWKGSSKFNFTSRLSTWIFGECAGGRRQPL